MPQVLASSGSLILVERNPFYSLFCLSELPCMKHSYWTVVSNMCPVVPWEPKPATGLKQPLHILKLHHRGGDKRQFTCNPRFAVVWSGCEVRQHGLRADGPYACCSVFQLYISVEWVLEPGTHLYNGSSFRIPAAYSASRA